MKFLPSLAVQHAGSRQMKRNRVRWKQDGFSSKDEMGLKKQTLCLLTKSMDFTCKLQMNFRKSESYLPRGRRLEAKKW